MRIVYLWLAGLGIFAVSAAAAGVSLFNAGIDRAYHDTYYVVAHLHYSVSIAVVFVVFAAIYFAIQKWSNRPLPFWAMALQFALMFIGIFAMFFPQHLLGRQGMPRRYIDYPEAFAWWNTISNFGALLCALSIIVFVLIVIYLIFWAKPKPPCGDTFD